VSNENGGWQVTEIDYNVGWWLVQNFCKKKNIPF